MVADTGGRSGSAGSGVRFQGAGTGGLGLWRTLSESGHWSPLWTKLGNWSPSWA